MAIHTEFSLTPLCGPQLPSVCLCVSIFPFWALVLHRALEMLLLARDGVLKCPAAAVTMTTWEKEKKKNEAQPGPKCLPRFFNLPSEPHHQLDESCTCNEPALLFLLFTGESVV